MSEAKIICGNPECRVAQDGKCIEGLELLQCRFYGRSPEEVSAGDGVVEESGQLATAGVLLDRGAALEAAGASQILSKWPSRVVAIVGAFDSGKTSLIAGLFDLFQMKEVGDFEFAGSSTLLAFEEICHDARVASLRDVAHSPRTERGEVKFFHLDIRSRAADECLSLIIGDRSGEEYEEVANEVENSSAMFELRRADTVTLLVDGVRLCDPAKRHDATGRLPLIVQGLVEGRVLERRPRLAVVLTKNDAVVKAHDAERAASAFDLLTKKLQAKYSKVFSDIRPFITAASPKKLDARRGQGLAELLAYWLEPVAKPSSEIWRARGERVFANLQPREE